MRITILNQFFLPDISPTAQLAGGLALDRAARGDTVTVICGTGEYVKVDRTTEVPLPQNLNVIHIPILGLGKKRTVFRAADYGIFFLLAALRVVFLRRQDVIVAMTTPPYVVLIAVLHKIFHRKTRVILWSMDCYPEVPEMAGMLKPRGWPSRILRAVNRWVYRRLSHVVALDGAMVEKLRAYAPSATQPPFTIIPNWEAKRLFPQGVQPAPWTGLAATGLAGKFIVLYLGNAGKGHEFETLIEAARELRQEKVGFLFVGGGGRWKELETAKTTHALTNLVLHGYVAKDQTPNVMAACGAALITLRNEAAGLISPSKLHSNYAFGLPVLYVGPTGSNVDEAIQKYGGGYSLRVGDVSGLVDRIRTLMNNEQERQRLAGEARRAFDTAYCDAATLPHFEPILNPAE